MVPGSRPRRPSSTSSQTNNPSKRQDQPGGPKSRQADGGAPKTSVAALDLASDSKFETKPGPSHVDALEADEATDKRFGTSSKTLAALDLALSPQALRVPAMQLATKWMTTQWADLLRPAKLVNDNLLVDKYGHRYMLRAPFMSGVFGAVRLALKRDPIVNQYYAAKEISLTGPDGKQKPSDILAAIRREVHAASLAQSPLTPHAILLTPTSAFILMPVISGDMFMLLEGIASPGPHSAFEGDANRANRRVARESLAINTVIAAAKGAAPLHEAGIAHRDIKPENIFYDRSGEAMLADFGLVARDKIGGDIAGTLDYLPFEALLPDSAQRSETRYSSITSDSWAIGATALLILADTTPTEFIARKLEAGASFTKMRDVVLDQQLDYRNAWRKHADQVFGGIKGALPKAETDDEATFLNMLSMAKEASPYLFPNLLRFLHPLPGKRPQAPEILRAVTTLVDKKNQGFEEIRQAKIEKVVDAAVLRGEDKAEARAQAEEKEPRVYAFQLLPVIAGAGLLSSQHWTPDHEVQRQLQNIDAAKSQRRNRSQQLKVKPPSLPTSRVNSKAALSPIVEEEEPDDASEA